MGLSLTSSPQLANICSGFWETHRHLLMLRDPTTWNSTTLRQAGSSPWPPSWSCTLYIKDTLAHLLDSSTYKILSFSEVEARDVELRVTISSWISKYAIDLNIDTRCYLGSKLKPIKDDSFGYLHTSTYFVTSTRPLLKQDQ